MAEEHGARVRQAHAARRAHEELGPKLVFELPDLTADGILNCRNPLIAAHQFMGLLNEFSLWPWMMGREGVPVPDEDVVEEAIQMVLRHYRRPLSRR